MFKLKIVKTALPAAQLLRCYFFSANQSSLIFVAKVKKNNAAAIRT